MAARYFGLTFLFTLCGHALAQDQRLPDSTQAPPKEPYFVATQAGEPKDKDKEKDKGKDKDKKKDATIPPDDLESYRPPQLAFQPIDHKPMLPDYFGVFSQRIFTRTFTVSSSLPGIVNRPETFQIEEQFSVAVPILTRGPFKVSDNASPRPLDRCFVFYDYYNDIPVRVLGANSVLTVSRPIFLGETTNAVRIAGPGQYTVRQTLLDTLLNNPNSPAAPLSTSTFTSANVHRENFGCEKTFFDGRASFEFRVPLIQVNQSFTGAPDTSRLETFGTGASASNMTEVSNGLGNTFLGDITLVGKYALIDDRETGNLLSTGLAVTVPTGQAITVSGGAPIFLPAPTGIAAAGTPAQLLPADQTFRSTLLQPFLGYILAGERWYVHGFTSFVIPTDSHDASIWFNDIGLSYRVYQNSDGLLRSITPTVEGHLATRLNHNNPQDGAWALDSFAINAGVHFGLGAHSILTLGASTPITGPRQYSIEAIVMFNFLY